MASSRFWIHIYIAGLGALSLSLAALCLLTMPLPEESGVAIAAQLSIFAAIAYRFPIHFDVKSSIILDTSIIFASVLIFQPGVAMLLIVVGAMVGNASRDFEPEEMTFNISQAALQAAAAGLLLYVIGWDYGAFAFDNGRILLILAGSATTIYLTNTILVSIVIAFHTGMNPIRIWIQSATRHDGIEQLGQFALGAVAAIVGTSQPWALPICSFPPSS
ncbi:MAG: hypothetical protein R3A46_19915 [Thermomicrobiales bacterium]